MTASYRRLGALDPFVDRASFRRTPEDAAAELRAEKDRAVAEYKAAWDDRRAVDRRISDALCRMDAADDALAELERGNADA